MMMLKSTFWRFVWCLGSSGVGDDVKIVADRYVQDMVNAVVGADEDGYHYVNANVERDFRVDEFTDIRTVKEGDMSPDGAGKPEVYPWD